MVREPREDDRKQVERLRESLTAQFDVLDQLYNRLTENISSIDDRLRVNEPLACDDPSAFDDMDENDGDGSTDEHADSLRTQISALGTAGESARPPEMKCLSIPSTWVSTDNPHRAVELCLRMKQASTTLQALRDNIADKSFQYSHVIRVAPNKGVRTRARTTIGKLNHVIAHHCHVYGRCRAAMVRLGADDQTLGIFQILLKEHITSSSALLNPNAPGSTRVRLSWIWQTGCSDTNNGRPDALRECESLLSHIVSISTQT